MSAIQRWSLSRSSSMGKFKLRKSYRPRTATASAHVQDSITGRGHGTRQSLERDSSPRASVPGALASGWYRERRARRRLHRLGQTGRRRDEDRPPPDPRSLADQPARLLRASCTRPARSPARYNPTCHVRGACHGAGCSFTNARSPECPAQPNGEQPILLASPLPSSSGRAGSASSCPRSSGVRRP
jgi:hypothetical protein